jgi:hypothetical protein
VLTTWDVWDGLKLGLAVGSMLGLGGGITIAALMSTIKRHRRQGYRGAL